jgi:hypothetical protein
MFFCMASMQWLGRRAVKGRFATERGGQKRQLHLQGFALLHAPNTAVEVRGRRRRGQLRRVFAPLIADMSSSGGFRTPKSAVWIKGVTARAPVSGGSCKKVQCDNCEITFACVISTCIAHSMDCAPPGGGSGTAPKGARGGPASLFAVDRREPFTQEPVGAPD